MSEKIQDLFRYDLMVKEALRDVVRRTLTLTAREGLPGEHHFYITFQTKYPGLRLSTRMRERYPDEMTIVLQHQFWDLAVNDHNFEVGLSFSGVPERLLIPFEAITAFYDPSVQFFLKFEPKDTMPREASQSVPLAASQSTPKLKLEAVAPVSLSGLGQNAEPPAATTLSADADADAAPTPEPAQKNIVSPRQKRKMPVLVNGIDEKTSANANISTNDGAQPQNKRGEDQAETFGSPFDKKGSQDKMQVQPKKDNPEPLEQDNKVISIDSFRKK